MSLQDAHVQICMDLVGSTWAHWYPAYDKYFALRVLTAFPLDIQQRA